MALFRLVCWLGAALLLSLVVATVGHQVIRNGIRGSFLLLWGLSQDLCEGLQYLSHLPGMAPLAAFLFGGIFALMYRFCSQVLRTMVLPITWTIQTLHILEARIFSDDLATFDDTRNSVQFNRLRPLPIQDPKNVDTQVVETAAVPAVPPDAGCNTPQCSGIGAEQRCKRQPPAGAQAPWFCKQHKGQAPYFRHQQKQRQQSLG